MAFINKCKYIYISVDMYMALCHNLFYQMTIKQLSNRGKNMYNKQKPNLELKNKTVNAIVLKTPCSYTKKNVPLRITFNKKGYPYHVQMENGGTFLTGLSEKYTEYKLI